MGWRNIFKDLLRAVLVLKERRECVGARYNLIVGNGNSSRSRRKRRPKNQQHRKYESYRGFTHLNWLRDLSRHSSIVQREVARTNETQSGPIDATYKGKKERTRIAASPFIAISSGGRIRTSDLRVM